MGRAGLRWALGWAGLGFGLGWALGWAGLWAALGFVLGWALGWAEPGFGLGRVGLWAGLGRGLGRAQKKHWYGTSELGTPVRPKLTGSSTFASASQVVSPNAISQALNTEGSPPTLMLWDACPTWAMGGHLVVRQRQVITHTRERVLSVALLLTVLHRLSMFVGLPSATFAHGRGHSAKNQNGSLTISMWQCAINVCHLTQSSCTGGSGGSQFSGLARPGLANRSERSGQWK